MLKYSVWMALAVLLAACGTAPAPAPTATLVAPTSPAGPPTMWTLTQSPLFPSEWPPTAATTWVRYTFAYGSNPATLMDGAYVTQPLTRTIVQRDGRDGAATTLHTVLESAGIQGVAPLDAAAQATLNNGTQIQAQCLQLQALPDEAIAAELREYYRAWIKFNGAFVKHIRPEHTAFFDWLTRD